MGVSGTCGSPGRDACRLKEKGEGRAYPHIRGAAAVPMGVNAGVEARAPGLVSESKHSGSRSLHSLACPAITYHMGHCAVNPTGLEQQHSDVLIFGETSRHHRALGDPTTTVGTGR